MKDDLNDMQKKVRNVAHETKSSIDSQMEKAEFNKVFKQVDETMKSITKEFKIENSKEGEPFPYNTNAKQEHDLSKNRRKAEIIGKIPTVSLGGIACIVLGAIGTVVWGIIAIGSLVWGILTNGVSILTKLFDTINMTGFISSGMFIVSVILLVKGIQNIKRHTRFKRYCQRIRDSLFCELSLLMQDVVKQKKVVISDLKQMRTYGYLQDIYFDKENKRVMFDHKTYLDYEEALKIQLLKDEVLQDAKENAHKTQSADEKKVKEIIEKGHQQLLEIKSFNDQIKGSVLYEKVEQFYKITNVIFGAIQKMPNNIDDIRKVHEYYLPSVIKMLDVYVKLNVQVEETENIRESKQHIEGAIDTLNKAFAELLDTLFEDEALDVYSDISVLHMVLAQEGLLGNDDFKTNK